MAVFVSAPAEGDFKPIPAGLHPAICCRILDLGTHQTIYNGKAKMSRKVLITWELHSEDDEGNPLVIETEKGNKPMIHSERFTLSLHENAKLTMILTGWRGKGFTPEELKKFNLSKLLNMKCYLNMVRQTGDDGKTYTNIQSIAPLPKAIRDALPEVAINPIVDFSLDEPDWEVFRSLSEGLRSTIEKSVEYQEKYSGGGQAPAPVGSEHDEADPFADSD